MFRHVGLVVKDMGRMLFFYQNLLELEIISEGRESGTFIQTILADKEAEPYIYKLGKNRKIFLELLSFGPRGNSHEKRIYDMGITHFALTVSDLYRLYNILDAAKISFLSAPKVSPSGKHFVCFCRDPEGNLIELVEEL